MSEDFKIEDHCFVPPSYEPGETDYKDRCAFEGCGKPEIEHLWTVEAHMNNKMALEQ